MPKQPFTVADYLLTRLKQLNVTDVFQIPGDYVKHFTQALENFPGINTIGAINELDAAYAADAYGRTRGLGAVSLQYGVSTFSALNAIAGAYRRAQSGGGDQRDARRGQPADHQDVRRAVSTTPPATCRPTRRCSARSRWRPRRSAPRSARRRRSTTC